MAGMETPEDDVLEQEQPVDDPALPVSGDPDLSVEVPEADAAEQHTPVRDEEPAAATTLPAEANEADAAEQARTVELDEDEYR